jgi:hypothetical protein
LLQLGRETEAQEARERADALDGEAEA